MEITYSNKQDFHDAGPITLNVTGEMLNFGEPCYHVEITFVGSEVVVEVKEASNISTKKILSAGSRLMLASLYDRR